jgi:hypothetical protein
MTKKFCGGAAGRGYEIELRPASQCKPPYFSWQKYLSGDRVQNLHEGSINGRERRALRDLLRLLCQPLL